MTRANAINPKATGGNRADGLQAGAAIVTLESGQQKTQRNAVR